MVTRRLSHARLYARTLANLEPAQVTGRLRRHAQQRLIRVVPASFVRRWLGRWPEPAGWPTNVAPLRPRFCDPVRTAEACAAGRFSFLGEERALGSPPDWDQADAPHLWRFCLHDFEWAWTLAAHPDRSWARNVFAELWRDWRAAIPLGHADAWSPYVASLRAWTWCGLYHELVAGEEHAEDLHRDLAVHAGYLGATLERDLGGNHLVKNLKALIGLGVFFGDDELASSALTHLIAELDTQVLADGGHFERSPSYHCQVLGDLVDVAALFAGAGRDVPASLTGAVARMRAWLGAMRLPDGDIPLFNDSVRQGRERLDELGAGPWSRGLTVLEPSGYVSARLDERTQLLCDVGAPGPPTLPAHAHADCLSFELAVAGRRVIVDTGASTYEPGAVRAHERSTLAHNTVTVDGANQTEVWGTFRAARLAEAQLHTAHTDGHTVIVTGSHDGYARLPGTVVHTRTFELDPGRLRLTDALAGWGLHQFVSRLHLPADAVVVPDAQGMIAAVGDVSLRIRAQTIDGGALPLRTVDTWVATGFGAREAATAVELAMTVALPQRWMLTLRWGSEAAKR